MSHRARLLEHWRSVAERWEALRKPLARATGLRTWNPALYGLPVYERFAAHYTPVRPGALLAVGLNPGKYGMSQTGLPFTDVATAKAALPKVQFDLDAPGLAPASLRPFLASYGRERSCQSVYAFLDRAYGSAAEGWKDVWVATPCSLLLLERDGENVTPADARVARVPRVQELRLDVVREAIRVARPRGVVLFGQDVARLAGAAAAEAVGAEKVLVVDHPVARGPGRRGPAWWAAEFEKRLRAAGLL